MTGTGTAPGKVILFGEHAVVHGEPALAATLPFGVEVCAEVGHTGGVVIDVPGLDDARLAGAVATMAQRFGVEHVRVTVKSALPIGGGLGSSAAMGVALHRALAAATGRTSDLDRDTYAWECVFHGRPSGVDTAVAARGGVWLFRRGDPPVLERVPLEKAFPVVLIHTGEKRATASNVASFGKMVEEEPVRCAPLVQRLGAMAIEGAVALRRGETGRLGALMTESHGILRGFGVSCDSLEAAIEAARASGAAGAKLTGAGGGGAAIAVGSDPAGLARGLEQRGFHAQVVEVGP